MVSTRSRRLLGKPEPSTSALQRGRDAGSAGTEPGHYNDFGDVEDAGLWWGGERRGSPGHQCGGAAAGPALSQGVGFSCGPPHPSAPSQPGLRLGRGSRHPWQSLGNARAEGELDRKWWLWAPSTALPGQHWGAGLSCAGASPHRLAEMGLTPSA